MAGLKAKTVSIRNLSSRATVVGLSERVYTFCLIGDKLELQLFIKISTARNAGVKW
jgi:hypothetical protein